MHSGSKQIWLEATVVSYELYKEENSAIFGGVDCI